VCDRADGLAYAKRDLWSYAVVDAYAQSFERAGFADDVAVIRERQAAGDRDAAIDAVSDAFVDAIDIMGDEAHVAASVKAYVDAGVDVPVVMPLPWGADRRAVVDATIRAASLDL
jgi:hypothetical protein